MSTISHLKKVNYLTSTFFQSSTFQHLTTIAPNSQIFFTND